MSLGLIVVSLPFGLVCAQQCTKVTVTKAKSAGDERLLLRYLLSAANTLEFFQKKEVEQDENFRTDLAIFVL